MKLGKIGAGDPSSATVLIISSASSQAVFAGMARSYNSTMGAGRSRDLGEDCRQAAETLTLTEGCLVSRAKFDKIVKIRVQPG